MLKKSRKIADLFEVVSGSTPSTVVEHYWSENGNGIKWITPKDLSSLQTPFIENTQRKISKEGLQSCSANLIPKNSIILSSRAPIGYVAILKDEMSCNQGCKALIPIRKNEIDPLYFYYLLLTKELELNNLGSGSTFKELPKTKLEEFKVGIHALNEQQQIAQVLEQADRARQQRKAANALTDEFLQSSFLSLFGDPVKNEKGWEICKVIDVCNCIVPGRDKPKSFTGNIPWVTTDDLDDGFTTLNSKKNIGVSIHEIKQVRAKIIPIGSVLMTCVGDLGVVSIANKEMVINQQLHSFQCSDTINNYYLMYCLKFMRDYMYKMASSTTVAYMNKTICNTIPIMLPPLSLQQQFASIVAQAEQLRQKQKESEHELEHLFQSLLQKYFG